MVDLAIIGGGPAALSAAIYAARAGLEVEVYEKGTFGGILPNIPTLENYPGYWGEGAGLAEAMRRQAEQAGAKLEYGECTTLEAMDDGGFRLEIDGETTVKASTVLAATGSKPRELSFIPSAPVSYCALCDGPLVKGRKVAVIGGANSAVQEAIFLAKIAKAVTIITHSELKADAELQKQLQNYPNISVIEHLEPNSENLQDFEHIFVYIGKLPATEFLQNLAKNYTILGRDGYVLADTENPEFPHQTVIKGLFAAGDVRHNSTKQIVTAAADGAEAAIETAKFCQNLAK